MALISSRVAGCLLCGRPNADCTSPGHQNAETSQPTVIEEDPAMADEKKNLKVYEVDQGNGITAKLKLSDEDAERLGVKRSVAAGGKARTAPNKGAGQPTGGSQLATGDGTHTP